MTHNEPPEQAHFPDGFPYEIVWEDFQGRVVTFDDLTRNEDQYEILNSADVHQHFGTFRYDPDSLVKPVKALGLEADDEDKLHQRLKLVAGYYLAPERQRMLGTDRFTSLGLLNKIAGMADEFAELLDQLPPTLAAVLHLTPTDEPLADRPDAPMPHQLSQLVRGLGVAAAYHAVGAAPKRTGPRGHFVRDTMLKLTMQAMLDAGLGYPGTSDGTKAQSGKHLTRPAGVFMRQFFSLVAPKLDERVIVPLIRQLRPSMRKAQIRRESHL